MAPLHLLMVTTKSGRRKEIIITEGAGEGGYVDEVGEGVVATTEVGGVVATVMIMAMPPEAGTMKSKTNTMMSPRNMLLPLAADVAEGEGAACLGVGVEAAGHRAVAEGATTRREKCDVPNACAY